MARKLNGKRVTVKLRDDGRMVVIMDDGSEQLVMRGESVVIEPIGAPDLTATVAEDFEPIRDKLNELR